MVRIGLHWTEHYPLQRIAILFAIDDDDVDLSDGEFDDADFHNNDFDDEDFDDDDYSL